MCLNPVKTIPKRYYSNAFFKNKVVETVNYEGVIYNSYNKYVYFPCGKCYECRESRIESWQIRWKEHLDVSLADTSYLLTLTYSDEHLPLKNSPIGVVSSLHYPDVQKFLKRLRKCQETYCRKNNIVNQKISYHGCGEYGNNGTKRPHYHLLITNLLIDPNLIESIWSHGLVHYGDDVTEKTVKYVLKYTLKNSLINQKKDRIIDNQGEFRFNIIAPGQKNEYRVAEKTFCSKGIGKSFITQERIKYYHENPNANYLWYNYTEKGACKVKPLPRYYKELIFNPNIMLNGKILRDDYGRPRKLYDPLVEGFEDTPRFKKMMLSYKTEQLQLQVVLNEMCAVGYDKYIEIKRAEKYDKIERYKSELRQREAKQNHKNKYQGALLI